MIDQAGGGATVLRAKLQVLAVARVRHLHIHHLLLGLHHAIQAALAIRAAACLAAVARALRLVLLFEGAILGLEVPLKALLRAPTYHSGKSCGLFLFI